VKREVLEKALIELRDGQGRRAFLDTPAIEVVGLLQGQIAEMREVARAALADNGMSAIWPNAPHRRPDRGGSGQGGQAVTNPVTIGSTLISITALKRSPWSLEQLQKVRAHLDALVAAMRAQEFENQRRLVANCENVLDTERARREVLEKALAEIVQVVHDARAALADQGEAT